MSQVIVDSATPRSTRPTGRTAEHVDGRRSNRQLQADVDLLALTTTVRCIIPQSIVVINVRKKIKNVNKRVFYEKNKKRL